MAVAASCETPPAQSSDASTPASDGAAPGDLALGDAATPDLSAAPDLALPPPDLGGACPAAWTSLSMGGNTTCGLTSDGTAYCWGDNTYGEFGNGGVVTPALSPTRAGGMLTFTQIETGGFASCGLATDGNTYCWGGNDAGQVGNGAMVQTTPLRRFAGRTFTQISVGRNHVCGLTGGGVAYCWGDNTFKELGCLDADPRCTSGDASGNSPVAGGAIRFTWIGVGQQFTCGLDAAGVAYCWGYNVEGECAAGATSSFVSTPTPIAGALAFTQLAVGGKGVCGIATDGSIYCWGVNDGGATDACCNAIAVVTPNKVPLPGGAIPASVSGGSLPSCAVSTAGAVYCWGTNRLGAMGLGNAVDNGPWTPTLVPGLASIAFVVTSFDYYACAVTTTGERYCWGYNGYGVLGDGTIAEQDAPELVACATPSG
jgi:alpha-tubulin suppressor-like RCC1 family protein